MLYVCAQLPPTMCSLRRCPARAQGRGSFRFSPLFRNLIGGNVIRYLTAILAVLVIAIASVPGFAANGKKQESTYQGKTIRWWANRAVHNRREINHLKLVLRHDPSVQEAVELAHVAYPALSLSRAWCIIEHESHGNPSARNTQAIWNGEHATGLWQFIPSTLRATPYGEFSIYSAYAQSLAAGWMHEHGRGFGNGGWTWTCR